MTVCPLRVAHLGQEHPPRPRWWRVGRFERFHLARRQLPLVADRGGRHPDQLRLRRPRPRERAVGERVVGFQPAPPQVHEHRRRVAEVGDAGFTVQWDLLGVRQPVVRPLRPQPAVHRRLRMQALPGVVPHRERHRRPTRRCVPHRGVGQQQARVRLLDVRRRHPLRRAAAGTSTTAVVSSARAACSGRAGRSAAPRAVRAVARWWVGVSSSGRTRRPADHRRRFRGVHRSKSEGRRGLGRHQHVPRELLVEGGSCDPEVRAERWIPHQVPFAIGADQHGVVTEPQMHERRRDGRHVRGLLHRPQRPEADLRRERLQLGERGIVLPGPLERSRHRRLPLDRPEQAQRRAPAGHEHSVRLAQRPKSPLRLPVALTGPALQDAVARLRQPSLEQPLVPQVGAERQRLAHRVVRHRPRSPRRIILGSPPRLLPLRERARKGSARPRLPPEVHQQRGPPRTPRKRLQEALEPGDARTTALAIRHHRRGQRPVLDGRRRPDRHQRLGKHPRPRDLDVRRVG